MFDTAKNNVLQRWRRRLFHLAETSSVALTPEPTRQSHYLRASVESTLGLGRFYP